MRAGIDPSRERFLERDHTSRGIGNVAESCTVSFVSATMASSGCWKCLSRPHTSQLLQANNATLRLPAAVAATAGFSTSAVMYKNPLAAKPKGPGAFSQNQARGGKTLKIKKKPPPVRSGKPPAEGERKALRKRIVLSNTNALEVEGLEDLGLSNVTSEGLVAKVMGLSGSTVDSLRASEAFKITQGWSLFRRPAVLVREESVMCAKMLEEAEAEKKTLTLVVDGGRVSGKSLMLLHAMTTAFIKGWIVLNIADSMSSLLILYNLDYANKTYSPRTCQCLHRISPSTRYKTNSLLSKYIYCSMARTNRQSQRSNPQQASIIPRA